MSMNPITSCPGPDGRSMVFYVDNKGFIRYYTAKDSYEIEESDSVKRNDYSEESVKSIVNGKAVDVKTTSNDLDALFYEIGDTHYFRLYYADEQKLLKELCLDLKQGAPTSKPRWSDGALGRLQISTVPGTPISAHVNQKDEDDDGRSRATLKVYYYHPEDVGHGDLVKPRVAWVTLGNQDWQRTKRPI